MIGPIDMTALALQNGLDPEDFGQRADAASQSHESGRANADVSRRGLLKLAIGAGAGLAIGAYLPAVSAGTAEAAGSARAAFNPFVEITPDNRVIVIVKHLDKGQGAATGLATLVADELDADWAQVETRFAPSDVKRYGNLDWGGAAQGTGGSSAISNSFLQYRQAGAAAKRMLIEAAAREWGVSADQVRIAAGKITAGNRTATLGQFAAAAAKVPVPQNVALKDPTDFVFIGKTVSRVDRIAKTTGAPIFTQDQKLPDMLTAVIARPARFGGKVQSVDAGAARAVKGVVDVIQVPQGVAVLATSTWAAIKGRDALKITWNDEQAEKRGTPELLAEYRRLADQPGLVAKAAPAAAAAITGAAKVLEAEFVFPFLAHAPMEPMNCVMQLKDGACTIWTGSQLPTVDHAVTAGILGLKPENVTINTLYAGGSFGRRAVPVADFVAETAMIVKAHGKGQPIKTVWTREDDIRGGYYRPMYVHKVRVGLTADGKIAGWQHRIVGQSILIGTPFEGMLVKGGIDKTSVEGVSDTPYTIPNMQVEVHNTKVGVPPLWWRAVGHTHTAYVMETMLDEVAKETGRDAVELRLSLLADKPRHQAVLKLAAEKGGWGQAVPAGVGRGIAVHESFSTYVAQVADVMVVGGRPRVVKVTAAVDCGVAVNPEIIKTQIEGGIGYGLGAVLTSKITLKDGIVEQSNFGDYEVLRYEDMPAVDVHIVASSAAPKGVGEPGTPPIGPAVANALAALTGRRVRQLPMSETTFQS